MSRTVCCNPKAANKRQGRLGSCPVAAVQKDTFKLQLDYFCKNLCKNPLSLLTPSLPSLQPQDAYRLDTTLALCLKHLENACSTSDREKEEEERQRV